MNWIVTRDEHRLISAIANRGAQLAERHGIHYERIDIVMDVTAAHANGCPLDLEAFVNFPCVDFAHDLFGIRQHINRTTGGLLDCFVPRCARQEKLLRQ